MKITDLLLTAQQLDPILAAARRHRRYARYFRDATPLFGPDPDSASGDYKLPDSFEIPAHYRCFKGRWVIPVLATGHWLYPEDC